MGKEREKKEGVWRKEGKRIERKVEFPHFFNPTLTSDPQLSKTWLHH